MIIGGSTKLGFFLVLFYEKTIKVRFFTYTKKKIMTEWTE